MRAGIETSGGSVSGITSGLTDFNAMTGGLNRSDLLILAGRPGMGKTSLATNMAFNAAKRYLDDMEAGIPEEKSIGAPVAFFSLEMSADQLALRILSEQSEVSSEKLRTGNISGPEFMKFARAAGDLGHLVNFQQGKFCPMRPRWEAAVFWIPGWPMPCANACDVPFQ